MLIAEDGSFKPLATDVWNWGKTYEQMARSVLAGAWESAYPHDTAVSYWWGMSSGVIDVLLNDSIPEGTKQLAGILKTGIINGSLDPFRCMITDSKGIKRASKSTVFTPEEIMQMNWLCENVKGRIPVASEIMPMARETTELLALPQQPDAPPEQKPL